MRVNIRMILLFCIFSFCSFESIHSMHPFVPSFCVMMGAAAYGTYHDWAYSKSIAPLSYEKFGAGRAISVCSGVLLLAIEYNMFKYFGDDTSQFLTRNFLVSRPYRIGRIVCAIGSAAWFFDVYGIYKEIVQNRELLSPYLKGLACGAAFIAPFVYPVIHFV